MHHFKRTLNDENKKSLDILLNLQTQVHAFMRQLSGYNDNEGKKTP